MSLHLEMLEKPLLLGSEVYVNEKKGIAEVRFDNGTNRRAYLRGSEQGLIQRGYEIVSESNKGLNSYFFYFRNNGDKNA